MPRHEFFNIGIDVAYYTPDGRRCLEWVKGRTRYRGVVTRCERPILETVKDFSTRIAAERAAFELAHEVIGEVTRDAEQTDFWGFV